ncbi:hypothetical protein AAMO2058_001293500 [Amorphochlora amoebiformis]
MYIRISRRRYLHLRGKKGSWREAQAAPFSPKSPTMAPLLPQSTIFIIPLIPSIICMLFSVSATAVLDLTDFSACGSKRGESLQAFFIGSIVLGYLYSFYHGFTLVGPDWMTKDSNFSVFFYLAHAILLLGWCIFGSVAASVVDKDCTRTSLFGMSVAFLVVYYLFSLVHIVLTLLGLFGIIKPKSEGIRKGGNGGEAADNKTD